MRELFISSDYSSSLIYIDMPFMDVVGTETATNLVNKHAAIQVWEGLRALQN